MHRYRLRVAVKASLVLAALAVCVLPLLTGCDLLDQLLAGGIPGGGTGSAIAAVMTAQVHDPLVDRGLNPDLRPPLMYDFNAASSTDGNGDPIQKLYYKVAWDFGDGEIRDFEWSDYYTHHRYWEEGTYTVTLTVREDPEYGNAVATAQKTITIGPAWLEIVGLTTEPRGDGLWDVNVVVRNQSHQALGRFQVDLIADDLVVRAVPAADLTGKTPDRLPASGTYTLKGVVEGQWTGTLRARSSWCDPIAE